MKYFIYCSILISSISFFGCKKNRCLGDLGSGYNFKIGLDVTPTQDSIRVSDTLQLKLRVSTSMMDLQTNNVIDFSRSENLGTVISFQKLDISTNKFINSLASFHLKLINGIQYPSNDPGNIEFRFTENTGFYIFDLEIIRIQTGTFRFFLSNAANVSTQKKPCKKSSFTININNPEKHFYIFSKL